MRLLKLDGDGSLSLTEFYDNIPRYAILSHRWEAEEVTFKDLADGTSKGKAGYIKIRFCGEQAKRDGLDYFWVDTCCIDKSSSAELSEAINSMFRWYQDAARCYVYLSDVSSDVSTKDTRRLLQFLGKPASAESTLGSSFLASAWFTRGWTLQELLAPRIVEFFSREGNRLGDKTNLEQTIHKITGIPTMALRGTNLSEFDLKERFLWAKGRRTTRKEDMAYSLFGIFDVHLPLLYGEGQDNAFQRLIEAIDKLARDAESNRLRYEKYIDGVFGNSQYQSKQKQATIVATSKSSHSDSVSSIINKTFRLGSLSSAQDTSSLSRSDPQSSTAGKTYVVEAKSSLPLLPRLIQLARTLQFSWFIGHLLELFCIACYAWCRLSFNYDTKWATYSYRTAFIAAAGTYGIVNYKVFFTPSKIKKKGFPSPLTVLAEQASQYFIMTLIWLVSPQYLLALLPYGIYSTFHVLTYIRTHFISTIQQNQTTTPSNAASPPRTAGLIGEFIKKYYDSSMALVATVEILLWGRISVSALTFAKGSWILFSVYTAFLRARFAQSTYFQERFDDLRAAIDALLMNQSDPSAATVTWDAVKSIARTFHDITDFSRYFNSSAATNKAS